MVLVNGMVRVFQWSGVLGERAATPDAQRLSHPPRKDKCKGTTSKRAPSTTSGAAVMTLHRAGINVTLDLLVIPLLVSRFPNLSLAAPTTSEGLVEVKLRQTTVGVNVR
jgi:hypothetical protein